jgi:hypothetical protein
MSRVRLACQCRAIPIITLPQLRSLSSSTALMLAINLHAAEPKSADGGLFLSQEHWTRSHGD